MLFVWASEMKEAEVDRIAACMWSLGSLRPSKNRFRTKFEGFVFAGLRYSLNFFQVRLWALSSMPSRCYLNFLSMRKSCFWVTTVLHDLLEILTVFSCQSMTWRKLCKLHKHIFGFLNDMWLEIHHLVPSSFLPRTASGVSLCIHQSLLIANSLKYPRTLHNPIQALLSQGSCLLMPE